MVLLSFSEPSHINKILDGSKRQTTRQERKTPIKIGDELQLYYRSRMKKGCGNCINSKCQWEFDPKTWECFPQLVAQKCKGHTNVFGNAVVVSVKNILFTEMQAIWKEAWAVADGFENWVQADKWFTEHNGPYWTSYPWVVITWDPEWLKEARA